MTPEYGKVVKKEKDFIACAIPWLPGCWLRKFPYR
jgi:hypothetical protein